MKRAQTIGQLTHKVLSHATALRVNRSTRELQLKADQVHLEPGSPDCLSSFSQLNNVQPAEARLPISDRL